MNKVFIDGQAGTTGLLIHQRLNKRDDIDLLEIEEARRKDSRHKQALIDEADVVILCLPDDAARETVELSNKARFIDASTAHRTHPNWTYGLPELAKGQRDAIRTARLVSNPGCYPTGFLLAVTPLIEAGLVKKDALLSISAVSGYSGGGKSMIERYEARATSNPDSLWHSRPYALTMAHKHQPEMKHYAGLQTLPIFLPSVGHFHQGMLVNTGIFKDQGSEDFGLSSVYDCLAAAYADEPCVTVHTPNDDACLDQGFLDPQANNHTNRVDLFVSGHDDQVMLSACLDNLGKGASAAAVQNLNLMLGIDELEGLSL